MRRALVLLVVAGCGENVVGNLAPVISPGTLTTPEDTPGTVAIAAAELDGDPLVLSVSTPQHGIAALDGLSLTYTPLPNYNGPDSVVVTASDGRAEADATVEITVTPVNDAPVGTFDSFAVSNAPLTVPLSTLLANDSDVDGDALTVVSVGNPIHGAVEILGTDARFTPTASFTGNARFDYTLSDGTSTVAVSVLVAVAMTNDPPVAGDDTVTSDDGIAIAIPQATLLANDTDVDSPSLAITAVQAEVHGSVTLDATTVTFTPAPGFFGTASFEYVVSDGSASDVGLVTVEVRSTAVCGDGVIGVPETCDDGNSTAGDGCGATCQIETGYNCSGAPSVCAEICGDGIVVGTEECDDDNVADGDGCSAACRLELQSIAIQPGPVSIRQQQRVQLRALGTFFGGVVRDVTATVAWTSSDPAIAIVGTGGAFDGRVDAQTTAGSASVTAAFGAIAGTTTVDVDAATCNVRINEIQVAGDGASASADEFTELVNPCTVPIDMTGWNLVYRSAAGTSDITATTVPLDGVVQPGEFRLYVGTGYNGGGTPDGVIGASPTGSYAAAGGGMAIRAGAQNVGAIVDSVGYGTSTNAYIEGTVATAPPANRSLNRSPFDGNDSNTSALDFVVSDLPTPRATNLP